MELSARKSSSLKNVVSPPEKIPLSWSAYPTQFRWRLLFAKAESGDLEGFKLLLSLDKSLINHKGHNNESILHPAVLSKNWSLCDFIVKNGIDPFQSVRYNSDEPWSPFDYSMTEKGPLFSMITQKHDSVFEECSICQTSLNLYPLECGHQFCYPCLKSWFVTSVNSNQNCVCPDRNCGKILSDQQDIEFLIKNLYSTYLHQRLREALTSLPNYLWCPFCTSGFFIEKDESCFNVTCHECNTSLCTECRWLAHSGTCDEARIKWLESHGKENEESEVWKIQNTKKCPNCLVHIQKNSGCSHMRCYSCRYEFCWICLGKYVGKHTTGDVCPCRD